MRVFASLTCYRFTLVLMAAFLFLAACSSPTEPPRPPGPSGSLTVTVEGLPAGANASVSITGPNSYGRDLTATTTLNDLSVGAYTITAGNVTVAGTTYVPIQTRQTRTVSADATETATVTYVPQVADPGSLDLTIGGLPEGVNASVTVTGPGNLNVNVPSSQTLNNLAAGVYTVIAANVISGNSSYVPNQASQNITVSPNATASATVTYSAQTAQGAQLTLTVTGLPAATNANITVTGPGGYSETVTGNRTLTNLTPGNYTVTAATVTSSGNSFVPDPLSQTIAVSGNATATVTYVQQTAGTGSLGITITGLPGNLSAGVTVTGPAGYSQNVTSSRTLTNLTPGAYTITASAVSASDSSYTPSPATQTVTVSAGATATASVSYSGGGGAASGSLQVTVTGLPAGVNASVTVTGPSDYSRSLGSTASIAELSPGDYTVTAASVASGGNTYIPNPLSQTRRVASNATTTATVTYVQQTANTGSLFVSVTGLPDDAPAAVTVTGPNNFSHSVTSSNTLVNLAPGTYTITAENVSVRGNSYLAAPPSQTKTVSAGTTARADITYTSQGAGLNITISGLPAGVEASVTVTGPVGYNQSITTSRTLNDVAPGTYTIVAENVTANGTTYYPSPSRQEQTITPSASVTATITYSTTAPPPATVTEVEVTPGTAQLSIGATLQLRAEVRGTNSPPQTVSWTSSNSAIATVNDSGLVTAVAVGGVNITATSTLDASKSGTATVTVTTVATSGCVSPVNVPDVGLRAIINDALGKGQNDAITCEEMESLTELWAYSYDDYWYDDDYDYDDDDYSSAEKIKDLQTARDSKQTAKEAKQIEKLKNTAATGPRGNEIDPLYVIVYISDLEGLQYAKNLTVLWLAFNRISDISPLANLTNLTSLTLWDNRISDISPLTNLTNLTYLDLDENRISNISALSNLTDLRVLWLSFNDVSNISPLANLTNLTTLVLWDNQISNISPLANLTNLIALVLWDNQISNISPLANLTNLDYLDLDTNQISNITPLVQNQGVGEGDTVWLLNNCLDLTPGGLDMNNINILESRGAWVPYGWQNDTCGYNPPPPGELYIDIYGLPSGISGSVTVTGPNGFNEVVTSSRWLYNLTPGTYNIAAEDVTANGSTYQPESRNQFVTVTSGWDSYVYVYYYPSGSTEPVVTEVVVTPSSAFLEVGEGVWLAAEVRGVNNPTWEVNWTSSNDAVATVDASGFVNAVGAGEATITATSVLDNSMSGTATITVYAPPPQPGNLAITISGLPPEVDANVTVTGPEGYTVAGSVTLAWLTPGAYTIDAGNVTANGVTYEPVPSSQPVTVVSGETASVTVTYVETSAPPPPPPLNYTLNVSIEGNGTVMGEGITCTNEGGDCTQDYPEGTPVTLTAAPDSGWVFAGWGGDCIGTDVCTLIMDSDKIITATFSEEVAPPPPPSYALNVSVTGNGTVTGNGIDCNNNTDICVQEYSEGTTVTLTAAPADGWVFTGWSGDCGGTDVCTVTMDGDKAVTATFSEEAAPPPPLPVSYTLNVAVEGSGMVTGEGIACGNGNDDCTQVYEEGTSLTLTANPASNFTFTGWSGDCSGTEACTVTMDGDKTVTATFTEEAAPPPPPPPTNYTLNVSADGNGTVTGQGINCGDGNNNCTQEYPEGTEVTLTANPAGDATFAGWSGDCSGTGTCTVIMNSNQTVTATFEAAPPPPPASYTLDVSVEGGGTVTGGGINCGNTCSQEYTEGANVTLTASPDDGFSFAGWSGACSGSNTSCTVTMSSNQTVTATFSQDPEPDPDPEP